MIKLNVHFLARLRDVVGRPGVDLVLDEGTLSALRRSLESIVDSTAMERLFAENVRIAVNQTLWDGVALLVDGDEVAFLPPVTGG